MQRRLDNCVETYTAIIPGQCQCGEKVIKVVDSNIDPLKLDARYHYPEATDHWCVFRCKSCRQYIHESWQPEKTATKYCRLLNYENACKVIEFINKNDKSDYAHVTPGGIAMQVSDKNWVKVETFIKSLNVRYEIGTEVPHKVVEKIVGNLKKG